MTSSPGLNALEERLAQRDRRVVVRTTLLTMLPVLAAAALLATTLLQIRDAEDRLTSVNRELAVAEAARDAAHARARTLQLQLARTRAELRKAIEALQEARTLLREAVKYSEHRYTLDWTRNKYVVSQSPGAARLLGAIDDYVGERFSFANEPGRGFTSPGFAAFVLRQLGLIEAGDPETRLDALPRSDGPPRLGDVVRYDGGYAMFYFEDERRTPFVIGMTPQGVTALEFDFGPERREVRRTRVERLR